MPLVSIIVPVYNVERFLTRCIESILAQTYSDFELILVDDGSTDHCPEMCDQVACADKRVRVIHKQNGGLASARNSGLNAARGEYILFCDSDDYVSRYWCENMMRQVCAEKDNYIFCGISVVRQNTEQKESTFKEQNVSQYRVSDFFHFQNQSKVGFAWNVCYYAEIIRKYNLQFPTDVIVEDLPFAMCYLEHMKRLTYVESKDYFYYQDERQTLSRKYYPDGFRKWREKYRATEQFIKCFLPNEEAKLMPVVANSYLYPFLQSLDNTFDSRNKKNRIQKICYNSSVVKSREFQQCLKLADCSMENKRYINFLKKKWYVGAYALQTLAKMKKKLYSRGDNNECCR